jgi:carbon-monoxide dehydrogenase large subunit
MSDQILSDTEKQEQRSQSPLVGKPLKRKEDRKLLLGRARFVDDVRLPQIMNSAVVRSSYAHARIKNIDTSAALNSPGVRLVLTADDISYVGSLAEFETENGFKIKRPILARDEVRYFGEPIAFVVADSLYDAEDAAEKIVVDYEPLKSVVDPRVAVQEVSPRAHFDADTNVALIDSIESGGNVDEAFTRASAVVKLDLVNQRLAPSPIEPRGAVAEYDSGSGILHLWISTQGPFQNRSDIAEILNLPEERIRVVAPEVGGGFGAKLAPYSEDILVCIGAMKLGRPVKWIETRSENLSSMTHGRGQLQHVELASNDKGRILGLKVKLIGDVGAYMSEDSGDATFTLRMCPGQYLIPAYRGEAVIVLTNKVPHSAYRGASRPEAIYLMERAIDALSRKLGIDPVELRIRNFIPKENFPFKSAGGLTYDTGDYSMNLKKALVLSHYNEMKGEKEKLRSQGRLLGIGIATYVEICAFGPDFPQTAAISVSRSGRVTIVSGTSPHGQGHETPLAQIVSDTLGIKLDDVTVTYGDTALLPWATFTAGSRSGALGGSAVLMCAEKIRNKMSKIAAKELGASERELVFGNETIYSKAIPEKKLTFREVASLAYQPRKLPEGMESVLYEFSSFAPPTNTFPFGTHIAMVEIEKSTGKTRLLRYVAVDDCGNVINPLIVEGQVHGGIVQGLGQAMLEDAAYDSDGQLLATSFMDYQIPQAEDVPDIQTFRTETPTFANAMGIKGIGEAGTIAATPAIANAVNDALSFSGITLELMPFSMDYIKSLIGAG